MNGDDLLVWRTQYGPSASGDADGDNDTDGSDFLAWQRMLSRPAAALIPEPATIALTLFAVTVVATITLARHA